MNVVSLKDYAKEHNVSYEAVRQQVVRYKDDLEGHIIKDGRQQFLDEEAVAFLDSKRMKNPVSIIQKSKDDELEDLRQQKEQLLLKIAAQADQIAALAVWKSDNALALASVEQNRLALEASQGEVKRLESALALQEGFTRDAKAEIDHMKEEHTQELTEARQEAQKLRDELTATKEAQKAAEDAQKARSRWQRFVDVFK